MNIFQLSAFLCMHDVCIKFCDAVFASGCLMQCDKWAPNGLEGTAVYQGVTSAHYTMEK